MNTSATSGVRVDHSLIPWDMATLLHKRSVSGVTAAFVDNLEELSYRNIKRDVAVQAGQTITGK